MILPLPVRRMKRILKTGFILPFSIQASQTLLLDPNKRLEAPICAGSMNRIAVANDRITQVFGDEGTFESQNEENLGQVFLKPTAENGSRSLSLTLVTEQGLTQDLTLHPTASSATTVILKNTAAKPAQPPGTSSAWHPSPAPDYPQGLVQDSQGADSEPVLKVLRQAMSGQLAAYDGEPLSRPGPEGFEITWQQGFQAGPYIVCVYEVKNILATDREVTEQPFYRPGDLALTLGKHLLPAQGTTLLYGVSRP